MSTQQIQTGMRARSPLKLILFGEHGVLSGGRCLAIAIDRYGHLEINEAPVGEVVVRDVDDNTVCLGDLGHVVPGLSVNVSLEAPFGCGLGTSGAVSLLLSHSRNHQTTEELLMEAHRIENVFHGRSSGVDILTCHTGGLISFKNMVVERLPVCYLSKFKILIFDSKIPKNTSAAIGVGKARTDLYTEIADVAEEAYRLLQSSFTLEEVYILIRRNQELLDKLGVCPDEMRREIHRMRAMGMEAKITGSGCGGCLMTIVDKATEIPGWTPVSIDLHGFHAYK